MINSQNAFECIFQAILKAFWLIIQIKTEIFAYKPEIYIKNPGVYFSKTKQSKSQLI